MSAFVQSIFSAIEAAPDEPSVADGVALHRETLGERVTSDLSQLLISGRLAPGEKLSLRRVGEALGVSMTPVREAVNRLAADGALEVLPGRAVRVPFLTGSQFRELTRIRIEMEGFAAEAAATAASDADIDMIAAHEAAFQVASEGAPGDAVRINRDLHFAVYRAAGMPMLTDMIARLWLKAGPVLNLDMRSEPSRLKGGSAVMAHAALVAALRRRDGTAARQALIADISAAARHIESTGRLRDDATE